MASSSTSTAAAASATATTQQQGQAQSSAPPKNPDRLVSSFLTEVSRIEQHDSRWTSDKQIERLLRPGAKYRNLNPYEVLQLEPGVDEEKARKQFRKLSFLVHPDKNPDNRDRAKQAFDIVNTAYQTLRDDDKMAFVNFVLEEIEERFPLELAKKRKEAKKRREKIPEDVSEEQMKESKRKFTLKVFAEKEIERVRQDQFETKQKMKEHKEEEEAEQKRKLEKEAQKAWEAGREQRKTSWESFKANTGVASDEPKPKKRKKDKKFKVFKPPKLKTESRS